MLILMVEVGIEYEKAHKQGEQARVNRVHVTFLLLVTEISLPEKH